MEIKKAPVIIVGSGIAGLLTALKLSDAGVSSLVVTKTHLKENSSWMAQGGIAAVLPENTSDSIELHVKDTIYAGAGLSDESITRSVLSEGFLAIQDLIKLGVPFDRVDGKLAFTKEAAHSTPRILHAGGDATGRSVQDTLIRKTLQDPHIEVLEACVAVGLMVRDNRCYGVHVVNYENPDNLQQVILMAQHTILATGGIGRLYSQTTNPPIATGDGIALAYEAGAKIQDMEFVQFHPTAFRSERGVEFLISEALRGEGGILRDISGRAFARDYHPDGELAPRDVVTRSISSQIRKDGRPFVTLDITHLPVETIEHRFPNILKACQQFGVDIRTDQIPVSPAAHYGMGGVVVDTLGQTSVQNLYAVGEVISSGLHGANRLASNSLLECLVFARRVAAHIETYSENLPLELFNVFPALSESKLVSHQPEALKAAIQQLRDMMWQYAGILRDADGLKQALAMIAALEKEAHQAGYFHYVPQGLEFRNMLITSRLICEAALLREESRGAQYRTDFPELSPEARHYVQQKRLAEGVRQ